MVASDRLSTVPLMSGQFTPKYSAAQKEAMIHARLDRDMTATRVAQLAAEGMLKGPDGERVKAFEVPVQTVYKYATAEKNRRAGKAASEVAQMPAADGIEALRRRLLTVADRRLKYEEKRKDGQLDMEMLRQIARAAREAAHLTAPGNQRPRQPGQNVDGQFADAQTRGGLADRIAKAAAQEGKPETATDLPPNTGQHRETQGTEEGAPYTAHAENAGNGDTERSDATDADSPGLLARRISAADPELAAL